jgi:hypothetical protein
MDESGFAQVLESLQSSNQTSAEEASPYEAFEKAKENIAGKSLFSFLLYYVHREHLGCFYTHSHTYI